MKSKLEKNQIFEKLKEAEDRFFNSQFLSPVIRNGQIRVRISGVVLTLKIKNFEGWGIFSIKDRKVANFIRKPNMAEKRAYLDLFPVLRLILCYKSDNQWLGVPANQADTRFRVSGLVPIQLTEEVQLFEVVQTRFDGVMCWFDSIDSKSIPKKAIYLRDSLTNLLDPEKLEFSGLTIEERNAYTQAYIADVESRKDMQEERIKEALQRGGAKYKSYIDRGSTFTIEFMIGDKQYRPTVDKDTLRVQSAGICLSGGDKAFDLQSLVGVIMEGEKKHRIVRVGYEGMSEAEYRRIHPERARGIDYDDYDD